MFLGAAVMAVGAVVVWIELLVRQAAIYVAVLFLPLAVAGLVWPATAHWFKRLAHILVAVILSKFVIAAILSLAASGLAASTPDGGGFSAVLGGGALLTLAALSPLALLRAGADPRGRLRHHHLQRPQRQDGGHRRGAWAGRAGSTARPATGPTRDSTTPPLRTWGSPKPGRAAAAGGARPWAAGGRQGGGRRPAAGRRRSAPMADQRPASAALSAGSGPGGRRRIGDGRGAPTGTSKDT